MSYLVAREGRAVTVREVPEGNAFEFQTKRAAWEWALKLAAPAKRAAYWARTQPAAIYFVGPDGERKLVRPADL
jgi:hypothetical protein